MIDQEEGEAERPRRGIKGQLDARERTAFVEPSPCSEQVERDGLAAYMRRAFQSDRSMAWAAS